MSLSLGVLLVEDDAADAALICEYLKSDSAISFEVTQVDTLAGASEVVGPQHQVIILDLGLPDSKGLGAVQELSRNAPLVVLTGSDDRALALEAISLGAQDYLLKDEMRPGRLCRCLFFAVERHRLGQQQFVDTQAKETAHWAELSRMPLPITSELQVGKPLSDLDPEAFESILERYYQTLTQLNEQQIFLGEGDLKLTLNRMADEIGFLRGSARDVVQLHSKSLSRLKHAGISSPSLSLEGRFLVLELMGNLVTYYRAFSLADVTRHRAGEEHA